MGFKLIAAMVALAALGVGLSLAAFTGGEAAGPVQAGSDEAAAVAVAEAWLALVDEGLYDESWDEAAGLLRAAVSREDWARQVGGLRDALGPVRSRVVRESRRMSSLPGAPDGSYVVIELSTSFEKKAEAIETVTPMLEEGVWRVSGYFIR
jgi:hypothetical protein